MPSILTSSRVEFQIPGIKLLRTDVLGREIARATLYLLRNDIHPGKPYGLLEDVFVMETHRKQGIAQSLVREIISLAQEAGCYKIIATSRLTRPRVHDLYTSL